MGAAKALRRCVLDIVTILLVVFLILGIIFFLRRT